MLLSCFILSLALISILRTVYIYSYFVYVLTHWKINSVRVLIFVLFTVESVASGTVWTYGRCSCMVQDITDTTMLFKGKWKDQANLNGAEVEARKMPFWSFLFVVFLGCWALKDRARDWGDFSGWVLNRIFASPWALGEMRNWHQSHSGVHNSTVRRTREVAGQDPWTK